MFRKALLALFLVSSFHFSIATAQAQRYIPHTTTHFDYVPHTTTHLDQVRHGNHYHSVPHTTTHLDAVPHTTTHYDAAPYGTRVQSFYGGYSSYRPNYGASYPSNYNRFHSYGSTHLHMVPHGRHYHLVPHTGSHGYAH